jgi:mono/diheme cytochrome c family protein
VLAQTFETHRVSFPIPFPLTEEEIATLNVPEGEREKVALERALARGKHLVESRYVCIECHGKNFGGGTMIDAFPIGTLLGPNITTGAGSRTLDYGPADWDRIVRHGVKPDGTPAVMPSEDFQAMSDQELSDIVVYVRSFPAVANTVPPPALGPLGKFLVATGQLPISAAVIGTHDVAHRDVPPPAVASVEFGQHVAGVCLGCHRPDLSGGPIPGGDPAWVPARNLTPHPQALGPWTQADFVRAMREGRRPDGTALLDPMSLVIPYTARMTDVELEALWMFLRSVPPVAPPPAS